MAEKHIFIGLGGSGVSTLSMLKYKIYERTKATALRTRLEEMQATYRFMFLDTDSRDVNHFNELYRNVYEGGRIDFINDSELMNLGNLNPYMIYRSAKMGMQKKENRRILEACPETVADNMENRNLSFGAGALRLKSRVAFATKVDDFYQMLLNNINSLNVADENNEANVIHYWVVASSNGGTGSGTVNDVLYLVNMLHKVHVEPGNPKVGLILYMPRFYINVNSKNVEKYSRNAFAVFNELTTIQSWSHDAERNRLFHRLAAVTDTTIINEELTYRPFEFCIPVDFNTDSNNNMGDQLSMYSNVSELLYYIHSGQGASGFKSFLDNNEDGERPNDDEFFLIPMGYMAIRKPDEEFENYMKLRLKYELLRYGVIGSPLSSNDERKRIMMSLFNSVVKDLVFASNSTEVTYIGKIYAKANEIVDEEMADNLIQDNNGKVLSELPQNVNNDTAATVLASIETYINNLCEEKDALKALLKNRILQWAEENARKWGLCYVRDVLTELDAFCTDMYTAYTTDTNTSILQGLGSRRALIENKDSIESELDQLYHNAIDVTWREKVSHGNRSDVGNYFSRLKEWIEASVKVIVTEESFGLLKELAYGDHAILDNIISHVRSLIVEANNVLDGEKGAAEAYKKLGRTFYNKKQDVTSVYVPDITEYAAGAGWKEEDNLFSKWYAEIVHPTSDYIVGEGFVPVRNNDTMHSLEAIFSNLVSDHSEVMLRDKYVDSEGSHLFTNLEKSDKRRIVEDILFYAEDTMSKLMHQNEVIKNHWYSKNLSMMLDEMNNDAFREIQRLTQPSLFFPYNKAMNISRVTSKAFCVLPAGVREGVFVNSQDAVDVQNLVSDDPSVMYKIVTKLGLSFKHYDLYPNLKQYYDNCANKSFYHFHQAFALAGGDASRITLPREIPPQAIIFAKYLLMNKLSDIFSHIMRKPSSDYDAGHFCDSPVIFDGMIAKFATSAAVRMIDNEQIELHVTDGATNFYELLVVDKAGNQYTDLLRHFVESFNTARYEQLISELVKDVNFLEPELLRKNFQDRLSALRDELNKQWSAAGRNEKDTISVLLQILNEKLNTVDDFLKTNLY